MCVGQILTAKLYYLFLFSMLCFNILSSKQTYSILASFTASLKIELTARGVNLSWFYDGLNLALNRPRVYACCSILATRLLLIAIGSFFITI